MTKEKLKGLLVNIIVYICAFGIAIVPFIFIDNIFAATAALTAVATFVIFIITIFISDVSLYDPYWSVAPPVMILAVMIKYHLWNVNAIIVFALICFWALRLTANWFMTYRGLKHEDWRYAMYREKYSPFVFQLISFVGLIYVPTIVVYGGLTSGLFAIQQPDFNPLTIIGMVIMVGAVILAFLADSAIHKFLREHKGEHKTCNISVWKYSRHPNYLGEMSFWVGLYIYFVVLCPQIWYAGLGFLSIIAIFLCFSIPAMEKHNMERRVDYADYKAQTSMILLLPQKKKKQPKK